MTKFADQVYALLLKVPKGRVTTYKSLAEAMETKAYQAIGQVLRINPDAPRIPCHRVVASDGSLGGFMGGKSNKTLNKKIALLKSEGVLVKQGMIIGFDQLFFDDF